jgi:hypothetical protein
VNTQPPRPKFHLLCCYLPYATATSYSKMVTLEPIIIFIPASKKMKQESGWTLCFLLFKNCSLKLQDQLWQVSYWIKSGHMIVWESKIYSSYSRWPKPSLFENLTFKEKWIELLIKIFKKYPETTIRKETECWAFRSWTFNKPSKCFWSMLSINLTFMFSALGDIEASG